MCANTLRGFVYVPGRIRPFLERTEGEISLELVDYKDTRKEILT
jgi:hypothetical protein